MGDLPWKTKSTSERWCREIIKCREVTPGSEFLERCSLYCNKTLLHEFHNNNSRFGSYTQIKNKFYIKKCIKIINYDAIWIQMV